ncbi:MAG: hypothetical protein PUH42_01260 [Firmicutes bacterium]|uniref:hypothetical protein n=1 Tax=Lentihominibacter sp. TaxID=2944216 RepID=UPI002A575E75|nr:hypothetical protein [Lentihominibacter sp.]MCI5852425.1 hypothetical protein [Clostridiales bacterium]MDD7319675.1 hypothetical protein [Bacillota bacterium]MDY5287029.1 hypothetical protein [Lentihominibacter sp.]
MRKERYEQIRKSRRRHKLQSVLAWLLVFGMFFAGTGCVLMVDSICLETTGQGGNLVFNVEK